jgi:hypothetical protein
MQSVHHDICRVAVPKGAVDVEDRDCSVSTVNCIVVASLKLTLVPYLTHNLSRTKNAVPLRSRKRFSNSIAMEVRCRSNAIALIGCNRVEVAWLTFY